MEQLARAFEDRHLGSYVQIRWDFASQPIDLVKTGEADMAVTGHFDTGLTATPIAWDGIAVVVDFTNPVKSGDEARRRRHLYAHCNPVGTAGRA